MNRISKIIKIAWESPTITTWGSFFSKSIYAILLLPVITTNLSREDITIWLLFSIFIGLQNIGDMGFGVTFVRVISYAMGGAVDISSFGKNEEIKRTSDINWNLIEKANATTKSVYFYSSLIFIIAISVIGYFSLKKPIGYTLDQDGAWIAFIIILVTIFFRFNGNRYSVFLQGVNNVAMLRRWETITSILSIIASFFVVIFTKSLLYLIVNQQVWAIIQIIQNRYLCRSIYDGRFKQFKAKGIDKHLFKSILPAAWKTGVGVMMSYGVVQASGLIVAQMGNTVAVSAYLFSLKILDIIKNFSNAPFYSKVPLYNRLFIEGNRGGLMARVTFGMRFTFLILVLSSVFVGIAGQQLLKIIGSNVTLVTPEIWILMVFAYFFERYGSLHIQLYTITNNIIWHIATGISGGIFIGASFLFLIVFHYGIASFPLALLISSLIFYGWYAAMHSYKYFKMKFLSFEYKTSFYPLLILVIYFILRIIVL
jgi:O-antigen/teichoic acid export membrane protein